MMQSNSLAISIIAYLGNSKPSKKQIALVESLLLNTGIVVERLFNNRLTEREIECLNLAALGNDSNETAEILKISKKTVEEYRNNIKKKLGCRKITQAVIQGIKYNYVKPKNKS